MKLKQFTLALLTVAAITSLPSAQAAQGEVSSDSESKSIIKNLIKAVPDEHLTVYGSTQELKTDAQKELFLFRHILTREEECKSEKSNLASDSEELQIDLMITALSNAKANDKFVEYMKASKLPNAPKDYHDLQNNLFNKKLDKTYLLDEKIEDVINEAAKEDGRNYVFTVSHIAEDLANRIKQLKEYAKSTGNRQLEFYDERSDLIFDLNALSYTHLNNLEDSDENFGIDGNAKAKEYTTIIRKYLDKWFFSVKPIGALNVELEQADEEEKYEMNKMLDRVQTETIDKKIYDRLFYQ